MLRPAMLQHSSQTTNTISAAFLRHSDLSPRSDFFSFSHSFFLSVKNTVLGQCVILLVSPWAGTALCTVRLFSELLFKQEGAIVSNFVSAHEGWCDSEQILQTCAGEALFYSTCVSVLHEGCSRGRSFVLGGCVILVPPCQLYSISHSWGSGSRKSLSFLLGCHSLLSLFYWQPYASVAAQWAPQSDVW